MRLLCSLVVTLAALPMQFPFAVQAQSSHALDGNSPSIRWCLPETRDDPAKIISGRCRVYKECLDDLELDVSVDQRPFPALSKSKVEGLKKMPPGALQRGANQSANTWLQSHAGVAGT